MKQVMLVFGTRPEAIKMAPLVLELKKYPDCFEVIVCVTAQHREMLDQALEIFNIFPDIDLNLMQKGQDLCDVTSSVLMGMRDVFKSDPPDLLLVHGDTTTSFAASVAAFYAGIPVGHIEAGLRTYDVRAPFPEEFNRQVVGKLAGIHFAPTNLSAQNLLDENVQASRVFITGNTVIDSLKWVLARIDSDEERCDLVIDRLNSVLPFNWRSVRFILITGHRRENFGVGFLNICTAIRGLAEHYPDDHFVYPVHLNPNVLKPVNEILFGLDNVHLIEPQEYESFVYLLKHAYLVLTDSGGIQEEAPSLGKPVLVMRDVTERPEGIEAGTVELIGTDQARIFKRVSSLLDDNTHYQRMALSHNPYGDGRACVRIVDILKNFQL